MVLKNALKKVIEEQIENELESMTYEWPPQCLGIVYQPERPEVKED